jgi:TrpR-related protein YerC/YecD
MNDIDWKTKDNKELTKALLALKDMNEAERFLRDLMTKEEIQEFGKRFAAAKLLADDVKYESIVEATGLSSATIARVSKWLRGPLGGYRLILERLHHAHFPNPQGKGLSLHS